MGMLPQCYMVPFVRPDMVHIMLMNKCHRHMVARVNPHGSLSMHSLALTTPHGTEGLLTVLQTQLSPWLNGQLVEATWLKPA